MRILYHFVSIAVISSAFSLVNAQINRGSANSADTTEYIIDGSADSIFIFNSVNPDPYVEAVSPSGDSVDFDWEYYETATNTYEFLKSERDTISRVNITGSMGFRLTIDGTDTSRFWALVNDFNVRITNTDEEKKIQDGDIRCGFISQINAEIDSSEMYYYHPEDHNQIRYNSEYLVSINDWYPNPDSDPASNIFRKLDNSNLCVAVEKPYWEDTWYVIEVEDNSKLTRKDSALHESEQPHAFFSDPTHIRLDNENYYPDRDPRYYEIYDYDNVSAPALFLFEDESDNADEVVWLFGDETSEKTDQDTITHTYLLPGTYSPKIVIYKQLPLNIDVCIDTFPGYDELFQSVEVAVEKPAVNTDEWPNVFSPPNGDIEYFRFIGDISITNFDISIYNRYGKRVYQYQGNVRDWEGWNGKYKGTGKYVSTGVYYYVIKEMYELPDYEPDPNDPHEGVLPEYKRGFLHVYNTE